MGRRLTSLYPRSVMARTLTYSAPDSAPTVPFLPELKSFSKAREGDGAQLQWEHNQDTHTICSACPNSRAKDLQHRGALHSQTEGLILAMARVNRWFLAPPFQSPFPEHAA